MTRAAAVLAVLTAATLGCSGKSKPCTGSACPQVAGLYLATFTPDMKCSLWAPHAPHEFNINVSQSGAAVTMNVQPGPDSPVHVFSGTIDGNGAFSASEPTPMASLNVAFASVSGAFSAGVGETFFGTLVLNPPLGGSTGAAGDNCNMSFQLNAQGQGMGVGATAGSSGSSASSGSSGSSGSHGSSSGSTGTSATTGTASSSSGTSGTSGST